MNEFNSLSFSTTNVICLGAASVLLLLIPAAFWFAWRRKHKGHLSGKYLIAGAIGFLVFARVLELGMHYLCLISDNPVSRWINGNTAVYVLYGILMAGVFEECGRYLVFNYILKKDRTRENAVLYGIGHGGIEVWLVALPSVVLMFVFAVLFSTGDAREALSTLKITEQIAAQVYPTALAASQFEVSALALSVAERLFAMGIQIGLSVIVFSGVNCDRKRFLLLAVLLHMLTDLVPCLYQRGVVQIWLTEVWMAVWAAIICLIALRLYRRENAAAANG